MDLVGLERMDLNTLYIAKTNRRVDYITEKWCLALVCCSTEIKLRSDLTRHHSPKTAPKTRFLQHTLQRALHAVVAHTPQLSHGVQFRLAVSHLFWWDLLLVLDLRYLAGECVRICN